jgi:ribosomal protein S27AE
MTCRKCPNCGRKWYSADTQGWWHCSCGYYIEPEHEIEIE